MPVSPRVRRWLTGPRSDPSVRLRYWTEVEGRSPSAREVRSAHQEIGRRGWAASLLAFQMPKGQWSTAGTTERQIMRPRYISTYWIATVLADLGVTRSDVRIRRTAKILLDWRQRVLRARDAELCIAGNSTRALIEFGYGDHPVVRASIAWLLRAQKRDGGWNCFPSTRGTLDGWEGLAALAAIPEGERSEDVRRAIERGAEFYLARHLMDEGGRAYAPWLRLHFPNHFFYDVLVGLRLLTRLGYGNDPRLAKPLRWLRNRRRPDGTWALDATQPDWDLGEAARYGFPGPQFPVLLELPGLPSRWATVEALAVLRRVPSG